jgi:MarR family transcriptional regulator for hemolysin
MDTPIGRQLILTAKALRRRFETSLAGAGASLPAWVVLRALHSEPGLNQRELAERLHIEGPTLTRHLDRLEDSGWLARRRDSGDRRVVRVEITPAGEKIYRRLLDVARATEEEGLAGLDAADRSTLAELLDRINTNLEEHDVHAAG